MNNLKTAKMDDHNLLLALAGIISAFGVKEIWGIIKQKIDIGAKKDEREESLYTKQIEILTNKITQLETKIELLIEENIQLRVKVVKMEARLINSAKKKVNKKIKYWETKETPDWFQEKIRKNVWSSLEMDFTSKYDIVCIYIYACVYVCMVKNNFDVENMQGFSFPNFQKIYPPI